MKCPVLGCKSEINAMTGLQEIQKFMRHMVVKHKKPVDMQEALEMRNLAEHLEDAERTRNEKAS